MRRRPIDTLELGQPRLQSPSLSLSLSLSPSPLPLARAVRLARARTATWTFAALCALAGPHTAPLAYADDDLPLPLAGASYRVAQEAYAAYAAHRYGESARIAREAIRQRPDVVELRVLLANALAASGQREAARRELSDAIAALGPERALVERRRQIDALIASGDDGTMGEPDTPAFRTARRAYQAYQQKDYDAAIAEANEAIRLAPDAERLRLLLIDALIATNRDADAYQQALDAEKRFGDSEALDTRRHYVGARLAQGFSRDAAAARERGDTAAALQLANEAVDYAPDRMNFRLQLIDLQFEQHDLAGVEKSASGGLAQDPRNVMAWTLRGYARAAQHEPGADDDFAAALAIDDAPPRDARVARAIIADVWIAEGRPQAALDMLTPLADRHGGKSGQPDSSGNASSNTNANANANANAQDDTDAMLALRRYRAQRAIAALAHGKGASASASSASSTSLDTAARPVFDCRADQYGAACDVYAGDPGFAAAREARLAASRGDHKAAADYARQAADAAPDDPQHRAELIDALVADNDTRAAAQAARDTIDAGLLDGMSDAQAGFIAERAGDSTLALHYFEQADAHGTLPPSALADMGYASLRAHRNREGATYLERAIDAGTQAEPGRDAAATPQALADERAAHAEATRNWGFTASMNYRNGGGPAGFASNPVPGVTNNWQAGTEAYWRPFGSLGERTFELYARGYENFGVKGDEPSGAQTLQAALGARVKPFASVNAIFAFEKILPIGSSVRSDWLARAAWSDGFGTALRTDRPSWWTGVAYGELGHYLTHPSTYATFNARLGRTYRLDSISPTLTVFPHLVVGADYDSTIDRSIPTGIGAGIATRYWFRGGPYDAPRSFVDLSVQYRLRIAGDERAKGVFFGAVFAW
ncbi:thioredoxin-like negative regulator of GroEL [Paraburkholderia sp. GAS199]|uniref:NfrA family protein n=1 Tax=Paraburkholderia sp. GAS199 TaxID=3035126 RepID=UPI003D1F1ECF